MYFGKFALIFPTLEEKMSLEPNREFVAFGTIIRFDEMTGQCSIRCPWKRWWNRMPYGMIFKDGVLIVDWKYIEVDMG